MERLSRICPAMATPEAEESIIEMAAIIEAYFAAGRRRFSEAARPRSLAAAGFSCSLIRGTGPGIGHRGIQWIVTNAAMPHVIATKVDKSRAERKRNLRESPTRSSRRRWR